MVKENAKPVPAAGVTRRSKTLWEAICGLRDFYLCMLYFWLREGRFDACPYFQPSPTDEEQVKTRLLHTRVHLYSISLVFYMWEKLHYRTTSYQEDIITVSVCMMVPLLQFRMILHPTCPFFIQDYVKLNLYI